MLLVVFVGLTDDVSVNWIHVVCDIFRQYFVDEDDTVPQKVNLLAVFFGLFVLCVMLGHC